MKIGLVLEGDGARLPWRETQVEGVSWIPLHLDSDLSEASKGVSEGGSSSARGGGTVLIRMEPGRGYPAHLHVGGEAVLVLAGSYTDEFGEHVAGGFIHYPAGSTHAPVAGGDPSRPAGPDNPACVLYATAVGGIELVGR